ncbi:histidine phosphatase family protein [Sporichthya sp.]|uniref:histidine phosphatase family protein n=1 Tax=Sporichthya sp. TaxID=65475 RepID=UPI0017B79015|nr:histidine phosphatase family protein [Sporichthya sp.]MBA3744725.1 histidine phosphatase family protein [Sporichthya sp.]
MTQHTIVHVVRHGEVHNPGGVLYGRLPDFHLSELGVKMAERVAESFAGQDVAALVSSPLERAQETMAPIAAALDLPVHIDERLIETENYFEGKTFGVGDGSLRRPEHWPKLWNPFRPSWGEPYEHIAARMLAAAAAARDLAPGREIVCVSHQLPIWTVRQKIEGNHLWHDPRKRQCGLASITSIRYEGEKIRGLSYREPAADLVPVKARKNFTAGA